MQHGCKQNNKLPSLPRKFLELIPEESLTNFPLLVKNLFASEIPKLQLPGWLVHFSKIREKLAHRKFICSKEVHNTILEGFSAKDYSKTGGSVQNTGTVNRSLDYGNSGQSIRPIKKWNDTTHPRPIPEEYSPGEKEVWGKSSKYKLKNPQ